MDGPPLIILNVCGRMFGISVQPEYVGGSSRERTGSWHPIVREIYVNGSSGIGRHVSLVPPQPTAAKALALGAELALGQFDEDDLVDPIYVVREVRTPGPTEGEQTS